MSPDFEKMGYDEVRRRFDRGDYHDPNEKAFAEKWLKNQDNEKEFIKRCERASMSSSLDAKRAARQANLLSVVALVIAAVGARDDIYSIFRFLAGLF